MAVRGEGTRKQLWTAFGLMLVLWLPLAWLDLSLRTPVTPAGIVSFELAATSADADAALFAWGDDGQVYAVYSVVWDYLFMIGYGLWMSRLALHAGQRLRGRSKIVAGWGGALAKVVWFAVLMDALENAALLVVLTHGGAQPWPGLAAAAAGVKFIGLVSALFYAMTALLVAIMPEDPSGDLASPGG